MKAKVDLSKINLSQIDLDNVQGHITSLANERQQLSTLQVSETDAQAVLNRIATYRKLSAAINNVVKDDRKLNQLYRAAKGSDEEDKAINELKGRANRAAQRQLEKDKKNEKGMKAQQEKQSRAIAASAELFGQFKTAVDDFVQADLETMDEAKEMLFEIRKQLNAALEGHPQGEDRKRYFKNIEKLNAKISRSVAYKEVLVAADTYRKATTDTMDNYLDTFTRLRNSLLKVLAQLPKKDPERVKISKQLDELTETVTEHQVKTAKLQEGMRAELSQVTEESIKEVEERVEEGQSLLTVFTLTAPKALQAIINGLPSDPMILSIIEGKEELRALLGGTDVQSGMKQITSGTVDGTMVAVGEAAKPIPVENQLAVLDSILGTLNEQGGDSEKKQQTILAVKFLRTTLKGIQDLQSGTKQYATFIGQIGEEAITTHVSIRDLINNPKETISFLVETFLKTPIQFTFTSGEQAAALSLLANANVPNLLKDVQKVLSQGSVSALTEGARDALTQSSMNGALTRGTGAPTKVENLSDVAALILQNVDNSRALGHIFGANAPVVEQRLQTILKHFADQQPTPLSESESFTVAKWFAALILTVQKVSQMSSGATAKFVASSVFPNKRLAGPKVNLLDTSVDSETQNLLLNGGLLPMPDERLAIMPASELDEWGPFVGADVIPPDIGVVPDEKPIEKKALDLSRHKNNFNILLNDLAAICRELAEKQEEHGEKYDEVMLQALNLHDTLMEAGEEFFALKKPTLQQSAAFKSLCTGAIESAEQEFKQHRGAWWDNSGFLGKLLAVTKAILGVVAAVTVLPAVIVEAATKHGYTKTFFTKPETESATKLAGVKAELEQQTNEIDEAIDENQNPTSGMK